MLELLAPEHRLTLLTPRPPAGQPLPSPPPGVTVATYEAAGRAARRLAVVRAVVRGLPLQSGLFFSLDLRRRLRALAPGVDLVVLQLVRLAAHRDDLGATPVLLDLIDDLALNFSRRAAVDRWWLRPALALEARLLARAQRRLALSAAGVLLVCDRDRDEVAARLPAALASRVRTVGLAVEAVGGATAGAVSGRAFSDGSPALGPAGRSVSGSPRRLVFTGNLGYFVNADAISWWLREVWPALAARRPDLELVVAGDRPGRRLRRMLARAAATATAAGTGTVTVIESPPDLQRVLAGAVAALAPMRCGSGVPIKILEAWALDVPVVASPWAAEGTTAVPGEDLLIAATRAQWIEAVIGLLQQPGMRERLAAGGRRRLLSDYSRDRVRQQWLAAVAAATPGGAGLGPRPRG